MMRRATEIGPADATQLITPYARRAFAAMHDAYDTRERDAR